MARLQTRLVTALVVPAGLGLIGLAMYADHSAGSRLEGALAQRLTTVAALVADATNPLVLRLEPGDEDTRTHQRARTALEAVARRSGVDRIIVARFDAWGTVVDSAGTPIGRPYGRARFDRAELDRVARARRAASVLFAGPEGRPYKTGYAPFADPSGAVVGFVGVEAAVDYADALGALRRNLALGTVAALVVLLLAAAFTARTVADPLAKLSDVAARIGGGDLEASVPFGGPLEAQVLAATMQSMAASLKTRDEEMQMMLAGIAHEVRNPLGGIELFGGLLKEDLEPDDPRRKHVDKILRELGTLANVVNDFLHFARRRPLEPRKVSVHELVFEVLGLAETQAQARNVALGLEVPRDLEVTVDPEAMKRALLNLVVNAVQASPAEGRVTVGAEATSSQVILSVDDDGPGVPADLVTQIFQPFFTTKQKGTGLGLALVHKTVTRHEGEIRVERRPNGGARFVVTLRR